MPHAWSREENGLPPAGTTLDRPGAGTVGA